MSSERNGSKPGARRRGSNPRVSERSPKRGSDVRAGRIGKAPDPRVEGGASVKPERIQLPEQLRDPLGMAAGLSSKARIAPKSRAEELHTLRPIEERRTMPFIRAGKAAAVDAQAQPPSVSSPATMKDDKVWGRRRAYDADSAWPPEDHAPTDPAPARKSSSAPSLGITGNELPEKQPSSPTKRADTLSKPLALVASLEALGPGEGELVIEQLLEFGPVALDAITRAFPGPLWFDPAQTRGQPPPADRLSALATALLRAGEPGIPHLVHLLGASDRQVRFCAALVARELHDASVVQPLFRMLVDADPDNVDAAMLAIQHLPSDWLNARLEQLRASLNSPSASPGQHLMAARTLGALRDLSALEALIERVSVRHDDVAAAVNAALVRLTAQDFGTSRSRWRRWFKRHGQEPRTQWLLEGLGHSDTALRLSAFRELVLVTREDLGIHHTASKEEATALKADYQALAQKQGLIPLS